MSPEAVAEQMKKQVHGLQENGLGVLQPQPSEAQAQQRTSMPRGRRVGSFVGTCGSVAPWRSQSFWSQQVKSSSAGMVSALSSVGNVNTKAGQSA